MCTLTAFWEGAGDSPAEDVALIPWNTAFKTEEIVCPPPPLTHTPRQGLLPDFASVGCGFSVFYLQHAVAIGHLSKENYSEHCVQSNGETNMLLTS